jgi:hypothetical protein
VRVPAGGLSGKVLTKQKVTDRDTHDRLSRSSFEDAIDRTVFHK